LFHVILLKYFVFFINKSDCFKMFIYRFQMVRNVNSLMATLFINLLENYETIFIRQTESNFIPVSPPALNLTFSLPGIHKFLFSTSKIKNFINFWSIIGQTPDELSEFRRGKLPALFGQQTFWRAAKFRLAPPAQFAQGFLGPHGCRAAKGLDHEQ